mmetsp:Transcript_3442/g.21550  ORF Transcript_3442/g.21550 Transcript_3442/m.21550 type:complete len:296 (+) Transcript_3442:2007-2894(+)
MKARTSWIYHGRMPCFVRTAACHFVGWCRTSRKDRSQRDVQGMAGEPRVQTRHGVLDAPPKLIQRRRLRFERVDEGRARRAAAVMGGPTAVLGSVEPVMRILGLVHHALHLALFDGIDLVVHVLAAVQRHGFLADPLLQGSALVHHQIQVRHVERIFLLHVVLQCCADLQQRLELLRREAHVVAKCRDGGLGPQASWILRRQSGTDVAKTRLELHQRTRQTFVGERQDAVPSHHVSTCAHGASRRAFHLLAKHGRVLATRSSCKRAGSTCRERVWTTARALRIRDSLVSEAGAGL